MTNTLESIARGEVDAISARLEINRHIEATQDLAKPYSALLRWTWLALSERRADDDLRHWHRLILDVAARARKEETQAANAQPEADGADSHLAERLRALSDLIRVSVGMQTRPDKARLLTRAHVPAILQALCDRQVEAVARDDLLQAVEIKTANLSRIMTLLILEGLVERQADGRNARFRITGEGMKHLRDYQARKNAPVGGRESPPIVSTRPVRHRKTASIPAPSRDLIEAIQVYFEGEHQSTRRHERQAVRKNWAPATVKNNASTQIETHVFVPKMLGSMVKSARKAPELLEEEVVFDVNLPTSHDVLRVTELAVGGPTKMCKLISPHSGKTVDSGYTAFEATFSSHYLVKSSNG